MSPLVRELQGSLKGERIRVVDVAVNSPASARDYRRLVGQTGTVQYLGNPGSQFAQLHVRWDSESIRLLLAAEDRVEFLPCERVAVVRRTVTFEETWQLEVALDDEAKIGELIEFGFGEKLDSIQDDVTVEVLSFQPAEVETMAPCPACNGMRPEVLMTASTFEPGSTCPHCGHVEPETV